MSSTFLYRLPVEQTQWKVEGQTTTSFTWEYEDGSADLLRLYDKGKKQQWDAAERHRLVAGPRSREPDGLDDRTIAIYGTDLWNRLDDKERAHVRRNLQAHALAVHARRAGRAHRDRRRSCRRCRPSTRSSTRRPR